MDSRKGEAAMFMIDLGASSHYSILGLQPDADGPVIRERQSAKTADLKRRIANSRDPVERERLDGQLRQANDVGDLLANPARRQQYDRDHAHLTFFVVRCAAAAVFDDPGARHDWMHQAAREFLSRRGEQVDPITDLDRTDFTGDFTPNELLDRWLGAILEGEEHS